MQFGVMTVSKGAPNFCRAGLKAQRDEGVGRILLGDNTDGGAPMLLPIRFRCV